MKKTFKKMISVLLVVVMLVCSAPLQGVVGLDCTNWFAGALFAKAATSSGSCGGNVRWELDVNGNLTISGTGPMRDFIVDGSPFYQNDNIKNVVIKEGVTSIGTWCFYCCDNLESVSIPSSITVIQFRAFSYNESLKKIIVNKDNQYFCNDDYGVLYNKEKTKLVKYPTGANRTHFDIPKGVEIIGFDAFTGDKSLQTISFPEGVKIIEDDTFTDCLSLTSVDFPETLETIGEFAFCWCHKLKEMKIPSGVKEIGPHAFGYCAFEELTIPSNVKTIGTCAFSNCDFLKKLTIRPGLKTITKGAFAYCESLEELHIPKSIVSIGEFAFDDANIKDVYYGGSYVDWSKISISSRNDDLKTANKHYASSFGAVEFSANTSNLIIHNKDTGEPLSNKNILINDVPYTTSEYGAIVLGQQQGEIRIKCDGYYDYKFDPSVYSGIKKIYLERVKNDTKPYISTIHVRNMTKDGEWIDILTEDLFVASNDTDKYEIIIYFDLRNNTNASVFLAQDGNHLLQGDLNEGDSVKFTDIQLSSFFTGNMDIMAYIVAATPTNEHIVSDALKTMLTVDVVETSYGGGSYNLFGTDGMSFTLDEDIPVIGGSEISVPFSSMPVSMSVDDDGTYKFAFGIENASLTKNDWNMIKKATQALQKGQETPYGENTMYNQWAMLKDYNSALGDGVYQTQFIKGSKFDLQTLGYAEVKMVKGKPVVKTGYVGITLSGSYDWSKLFLVPIGPVPIPVYLGFGLNASGGATGGVSRPVADSELPFSLDMVLKGSVGGSVSGGAGIPKVLQIGPKVDLKFNYENQLQNKYHKLSMDLYGYIEAKALLAKWESDKWGIEDRILLQGTYGSASKSRTMSMLDEAPISLYSGIYNTDSYTTIADRDYLDNMEWVGGPTPQLFSTTVSNDDLIYEDKILQTSIYDDSRQQIVEYNGKKMIFWIMDDAERSTENRTVLVYSIYDDNTDSWSEPISVCDDGTADFYPSVCVTDSDLFVAWHNSKDLFGSETATLENMATSGEICVAKYNSDSNSFSVTTITNNENMDTMPVISASSSSASVVWLCNSANNIFGNVGDNTIKISTFDGNNWSEEQILIDGLSAITSIDCYNKSGSTYVSYSVDKDGELSDSTDSEIYQTVFTGGNITTKQITNNDVIDSSPSYININGSEQLVWYSNGSLNAISNLDNPTPQVIYENNIFTDNYSIAESTQGYTYFVWSVYDEAGHASIHILKYDGVSCSKPIQIGDADKKKINADSLIDKNGVLFVTYNDVEQEISDENPDYLNDVQTNLSVMEIYEHSDISLSGEQIYYDASDIKPSAPISLPLIVKNEGTEFVSAVDIFVDDVLFETRNVDLKQGDIAEIDFSCILPEKITKTSVIIKVLPKNDDVNLDNNEITLIYGLTDLSVECNSVSSTPLTKILSATIRNNSVVPCGEFTVNIREKSIDGDIIYSESHSGLNGEEALSLNMMFDKANTEYDEDGLKKYYVEVVTAEDEYNKFDNFDCVSYTADSNETVKTEVLKTFTESNQVKVYGYIDNNTLEEANGFATITAYDKNGAILGYSIRKIELTPKQMYTVEEIIDISGEFSYAEISVGENSNYTYSLLTDNNGVEISKYHGTETDVILPSYVDGLRITTISEGTFNGCSSIVSISIPSYVTSIANGSFNDTSSLEKILVSDNNENYCDDNGVLFSKDKTVLLDYPDNIKDETFEVPDVVKEISSYAFANCNNLNRITIPYTVTSVGANAFSGCTNATVVCYMNSAAYNRCIADGNKYEIIPLKATAIDVTGIKDVLVKGVSYTFNALLTPKYTNETITWSSSNEDILSIDNNGKITIHKVGDVTVTVRSSGNSVARSFDIKISELSVDTEDQSVYHIYSAEQMYALAEMVNNGVSFADSVIELDNDIDLSDIDWTPIGNSSNPFSGVFDGNGHSITNLTYDSNSTYAGLFGYIKTGGVKDLTVEGSVTGTSRVGMIAGYMLDSALYNCNAVGQVSRTGTGSYGYVGGLVGTAIHSVIINCAAETNIFVDCTSSDIYYAAVGGIVGAASAGGSEPMCILNSYCIGDITVSGNELYLSSSHYYVGGIAGYLKDDASNNYYYGNIIDNDEYSIKEIGYAFGFVSPEFTSESENNGIGTTIITNNYYPEGKKAIASVGTSYDTTNWTEGVSDESFAMLTGEGSLVDKLNNNKDSVEEIIVAHRDILSNGTWAELVERIDGDSFTVSSWKIGSDELPVNYPCECFKHIESDWAIDKEATCTEDGSKSTYCIVCGENVSTETIDKLGHSGGTATCTAKAECGVCGAEYGELAAHNQNGTVAHKDAKCEEDGIVGGTYCDACNEGKADAEATIPATGHGATEIVGAVEATFEKDGYTGDTYCTVCDKKIADGNVIPKLEAPETPNEPDTPNEPETPDEPDTTDCDHMCHSDNAFVSFFWKIIRFLQKLFGLNQICECGVAHW